MADDNPNSPEGSEYPEDSPQQSPEERLKALQDELAKKSVQLDNDTKGLAALKTDIEALTKIVGELNKAKTAFGQALGSLGQDVSAIDGYYKTKEQMVEAALGEKKKDVDAKIAEVDKKIKDKETTDIPKLEAEAKAACDLDQKAQTTLAASQQKYDDYKNLQKTLGDKIKTLQAFRAKIEEFDDKTKTASMYVILKELKKVLDTAAVPSQADFDEKLAEVFKELDAAKVDARQKKLACEAAKAALAKAQSDLATLEKNRVEDILKAVEPYNT